MNETYWASFGRKGYLFREASLATADATDGARLDCAELT